MIISGILFHVSIERIFVCFWYALYNVLLWSLMFVSELAGNLHFMQRYFFGNIFKTFYRKWILLGIHYVICG